MAINNRAVNKGGVFLIDFSTFNLISSKLINNSALIGGAIYYSGIVPVFV
jgi:hypothetical protein